MLTCQELTDLLLDHELGDLPEEIAKMVEEHRAMCPPCSNFARTYQAVPSMVRAALESNIDSDLQDELDAAILEAIRKGA